MFLKRPHGGGANDTPGHEPGFHFMFRQNTDHARGFGLDFGKWRKRIGRGTDKHGAWPFASRGQILVQTPRGFPEQVNGLVSHVGRMRSDRAKRAAMHAATSQIQTKHVGLIDEGTWMKPGALPLNEMDAWQTQCAAVLKRLRPKLLVPCTTRT